MFNMESSIARLQREVKALKLYIGILTVILFSFLFLAFTTMSDKNEIIRVKGIIVEDESGKDRILIGAPIPESKSRVRSDFEQAKAAWGNRFPDFEWYKKLSNSTNGIVLLDNHGYDKIVIGDPVPDPNIGTRVAPSVGIAINNNEGFERTGWGFTPDNNRVVFGLDNDNGTEGLLLSILEDGSVGVSIHADKNSIYLGDAPKNGMITDLPEPFHGLLMRDSTGVTYKINSFDTKQK